MACLKKGLESNERTKQEEVCLEGEKGQKTALKIILLIMVMIGEASNYSFLPALPKVNVWVTLANLTGQDTLCLATASPNNPFSTCLVRLPLNNWPIPGAFQSIFPSKSVS